MTAPEPLSAGWFADAFIRIRGAHNPTIDELDGFEREVRPCAWCRLAGEQAAEAAARVAPSDGLREDAKSYNNGYTAGLIEGLSRAEDIVEAARLVAQWHGAIGSGPVEVLDEELGALAALCASYDWHIRTLSKP